MARTTKTGKDPNRVCGKCVHSYDPHEIGADGKPFMVRCQFLQFCRFIDEEACERFSERRT